MLTPALEASSLSSWKTLGTSCLLLTSGLYLQVDLLLQMKGKNKNSIPGLKVSLASLQTVTR